MVSSAMQLGSRTTSDNIPLAGAIVLRFFRRGFTASESESSSSELLSICGDVSVGVVLET